MRVSPRLRNSLEIHKNGLEVFLYCIIEEDPLKNLSTFCEARKKRRKCWSLNLEQFRDS
jgi:hypothetical protein